MHSITTAYENYHDLPNEHLKRSTKIFAAPEARFGTSPMRLTDNLRCLKNAKEALDHLDAKMEANLGTKLRTKLGNNSNFYNAQHAGYQRFLLRCWRNKQVYTGQRHKYKKPSNAIHNSLTCCSSKSYSYFSSKMIEST